ncbi:MAG: helix-turn-helix domain-containing protein, partial [Nitrosopumilaceae archaeon]|nr:helix-turn-helix domain-containing protein [Nitrosopumilaceae archaeon]
METKVTNNYFSSTNIGEVTSTSKKNNLDLEEEIPSIHRIEELCQKLSSILDLDEIDAHIYLNLLRMGPVTASALARELHIDRTKAYRTIDKLLNLKIVSTTLSKPKLCIANKPEDVLQAILRKKEGQIIKIKNSQNEIVQNIRKTIPTNYESNLPRFHIAQGTSQIYSEIEKIIENAQNTVYIVTTMKDIAKMYHTTIPERINALEKKGTQVRLLTEITDYDMISVI